MWAWHACMSPSHFQCIPPKLQFDDQFEGWKQLTIKKSHLPMAPQLTTVEPLPDAVSSKIEAGIWEAAQKWSVTLPPNLTFDYKLDAPLTGNCRLAIKTKKAYAQLFIQLWRFCAWIGDYDSMIIFLNPGIKKFPAMSIDTLDLFFCYKAKSEGKAINSQKPAINIFGNPFHTSGQWQCPRKLDQCCSAIATLHCWGVWGVQGTTQQQWVWTSLPESTRFSSRKPNK